ncbi:hypothetical protein FH972_021994 [Carpinus fangiana]|uniref:PPPDE domain-containing protein n=1 Tax=Carpinus fangiana TaxID=176857 RepID=A0A5N6KRB1_9ROSI|nr:hypothetical protein FH972_021994 [Carpinus fangiana]
MLHTGVVIDGKEYAFGGHNKTGVSGVYYTQVGTVPPGGVFRCEILQGFTFRTPKEIKKIIKEASHQFQGPQWNLLTNNCNHFTHHLCRELTGHPAPAWINRAASIGVAVPCIVPKAWISPPDAETADGDLLEEDEGRTDEGASMLHNQAPDPFRKSNDEFTSDEDETEDHGRSSRRSQHKPRQSRKRDIKTTDTSGRTIPVSERAPLPTG